MGPGGAVMTTSGLPFCGRSIPAPEHSDIRLADRRIGAAILASDARGYLLWSAVLADEQGDIETARCREQTAMGTRCDEAP